MVGLRLVIYTYVILAGRWLVATEASDSQVQEITASSSHRKGRSSRSIDIDIKYCISDYDFCLR